MKAQKSVLPNEVAWRRGQRLADEGIYLQEDRYEKPKEYFKFIAAHLARTLKPDHRTCLDVGCATGEFIWYLQRQFPGLSYVGVDISHPLLRQARQRVRGASFEVASITDPSFFRAHQFDLVICAALFAAFDDPVAPMRNLLSATKPGGVLYVLNPLNDCPIDMLMRYRDLERKPNVWQVGWNIFSIQTYEKALQSTGRKLEWEWHDFRMPFDLPRQPDPMRCWTIRTEVNPHQLVNGAGQLIHPKLLVAHVWD